jgi:hypothetical protein
MRVENYYDILGIGKDADDEKVKQAFREHAKNCHPDRNPDNAQAEQQFKRINTAYEALKDAARREAYNEWLHFSNTRDHSVLNQWLRIFVLVFVLVFGPLALYWAITSSDSSAPVSDTAQSSEEPSAPAQTPVREQFQKAAPDLMPETRPVKTPPQVNKPTTFSPDRRPGRGMPTQSIPAESPETAPDVQNSDNVPSTAPERVIPEAQKPVANPPVIPQSEQIDAKAQTPDLNEQETTNALPDQFEPSVAVDLPIKKTEKQVVETATKDTPASDSHTASWVKVDPGEIENPQDAPPQQNEQIAALSEKPQPTTPEQFSDCDHCPLMSIVHDEARNPAPAQASESLAVSQGEVTIAEWNICAAEGACQRYNDTSNGQNAVRDISLHDAAAYVDWLSRKTGKSYRLLNSASQTRPQFNSNCNADPGWEWLDDNCVHKRSSDLPRGFRVTRAIGTALH